MFTPSKIAYKSSKSSTKAYSTVNIIYFKLGVQYEDRTSKKD